MTLENAARDDIVPYMTREELITYLSRHYFQDERGAERAMTKAGFALIPTEPTDAQIEAMARAIRSGRECEGEFPCPFCNWGPDDLTPQWDETGCIWLARAAFAALIDEVTG